MLQRFCLVTAALTLSACTPHVSVPDGTAVLNEDVALTRSATALVDVATRELTVEDDAILVAVVDEDLTDVKLALSVLDAGEDAPQPVEVENNLVGVGVELAVLAVPSGARIRVTLTGPQDMTQPGKVHLTVRQYAGGADREEQLAAQIDAARAWTAATNSAFHTNDFKKTGLPEIQRAIDGFGAASGDKRLQAHAQLIRAKMLYLAGDPGEAHLQAQRAGTAFASLPKSDALNEARSKYVEAQALSRMTDDSEAKNPTAAEARAQATGTLVALSQPSSLFGPIERARAFDGLAQLDIGLMHADDANQHFEAASALYENQGHVAGVREIRCKQAMVLVDLGRFADGALAFDPLIPELDRISDPALRVDAYLSAGRGMSLSGRSDQATELFLKALPRAREFQLRVQEAIVSQELGNLYQNRGDLQQAHVFYDEALRITREEKDVTQHVWALMAAANVARLEGDLDRSFKLLEEAVSRASIPIAQVRSRFDLGVAYYTKEDYPAAIAQFRKSLSGDLQDPRHHAFTDVKTWFALAVIKQDGSTHKELAEASRLLGEALETSTRVRDDWRVISVLRSQAELDARLGKKTAALANFERALTLSQDFRARSASIEVRTTMLRDELGAFRGYLDNVLANVAKRGAGLPQPASAVEMVALRRLERARQMSFGALRVGPLDAASAARVDALLQDMGQKSLRIATLMQHDLAATDASELRALQLDMSRLHVELDHLRQSAAAKHVRAMTSPGAPPDWRALKPGTVQLSYAIGEEHVYALVRSAAGTRVTVLSTGRSDLEKQLAELSKLDAGVAPRDLEMALERVSAVLLPAGLLPRDSSAVEIVGEGRIASVPFPALRSPVDPRRPLVETHDIAMVTSLFNVDAAPRQKSARPLRFVALASGSGTYRAAAVADPVPRLQAATKEIRVAAALFEAREPSAKIKLLMGADGNAAALRDIWASGVDVVHFATHALADLRQPIASLLVLPATDANGKATYLTAGQVQGWHGDAELVFLSACESAIGPPQYASGMPGLQRAFLRAGARAVIATLAPIEDVLAQQFAEDFYTRFTSGQSAARALTDTQRAWLSPKPGASEAEQQRRRITALAHAYFAG